MHLLRGPQTVDLLISNFVYEKQGATRKKIMQYRKCLPQDRIFGWEEVKHMPKGKYLLMHSMIYRTKLLHECNLELPKHTFYVDNLFAFEPLPYVKNLYYLDVNFYRYFIGRDDQSVNEKVMIKRIDQQIRVNKLMVDAYINCKNTNKQLKAYMFSYLDIITTISSIMLIRANTEESLQKKKELLEYIRTENKQVYRKLRHSLFGRVMNLPGRSGRKMSVAAYKISQYIGRKKNDDAGESASQLLSFSAIFSILIAVMVLIGNEGMLRLMFGKVEDSVMRSCITYLRISAYSYPALAVYNAGAALFRSIGKTSLTMYLSVISNIINVVGNLIGVFVLRAGVAGVAYPSLIARTFSAVMITVLCFQRKNEVFYRCKWIFRWNVDFMKQILKIAIPNGMENGVFQLVKVALSSIVALFGTYQIAANGVAQSIWSLAALAGVSMGPVFITVIGQCMGNGDADAAEHYFKRLTRITLLISSAWNLLIFLLTPFFMKFYALQPETKRLVIWLVLIHNVFNAAAYPFSGALSNGLRAAGDVKFTMYVSVISTIAVRLLLSWLLGIVLKMGVIGIAIAMVCDWSIRAVIFFWRQKSGKWKTFQVI